MKNRNTPIFLAYMGINSPQSSGFSYGLSYIGAVLKEASYLLLINTKKHY